MGTTIYPPPPHHHHYDHYPSYLEIFIKDSYFTVIVGATQVGTLVEKFVLRKVPALFCPLEGHRVEKFGKYQAP